jgi:hypothetical protein
MIKSTMKSSLIQTSLISLTCNIKSRNYRICNPKMLSITYSYQILTSMLTSISISAYLHLLWALEETDQELIHINHRMSWKLTLMKRNSAISIKETRWTANSSKIMKVMCHVDMRIYQWLMMKCHYRIKLSIRTWKVIMFKISLNRSNLRLKNLYMKVFRLIQAHQSSSITCSSMYARSITTSKVIQ